MRDLIATAEFDDGEREPGGFVLFFQLGDSGGDLLGLGVTE